METNVERLEGNAVRLTVTASPDDVDLAITRAYSGVAKKLRIPGFRAGKAPRAVIDSRVGRDAVLADATEELVQSLYSKAVTEEGLRPVEQPELEELDVVTPGEPFTFSAEVDVRPEFQLSSLEGLAVTVPPRTAENREIDAEIEHLRERFATLEPVTDRGLEDGDFALVSFVGRVDGEEYEGNVVDKYNYELGRGLMPKDFDDQLLGARAGDERHVSFVVPDTSSNPEFVGKEATFEVTVHEVKTKVLPELDDEFAGTVGGFDSLDELRMDIRTKMDAAKEVAYHQQVERNARHALAERAEGEVPSAMLETRFEAMTRDFMTGLEQRGVSIEEYLEATNLGMERIESDIRQRAHESLVEELALEALFRELDMDVTDADVDLEIREMVGPDSEMSVEEMRAKWDELGLLDAVRDQAVLRKAVLWLVDHVEVTEERPETRVADKDVAAAAAASSDTDETGEAAEGPADDESGE